MVPFSTSVMTSWVADGFTITVPLLPRLFISAGVDLYGAEYAPLGWAWSADTTVGLRVHLDAAHQRL